MKRTLAIVVSILLSTGGYLHAHPSGEYEQSSTISVLRGQVQVQLCLSPGVAVYRSILTMIDLNADGAVSESEQQAYAQRVLGDVSLTVDGQRLPLRLAASKFAAPEALKEGRGTIEVDLTADVPANGQNRKLVFENKHRRDISTYSVNALTTGAPGIQVAKQERNPEQSELRLDYVQSGESQSPIEFLLSPALRSTLCMFAVLLLSAGGYYWLQRRGSGGVQ
ncbi:MAG: hypothetical protein J0H49_15700 [Acidobacteria bacterium]|nr:hypothetical protein [Acidobacteriota bacterium]